MNIQIEKYTVQQSTWPSSGQHIMAQFDNTSVVVYQAYNTRIGQFAASHHYFGGDFSLTRMSWIKPNFLWMMYRSGWGSKPDQETTLAVRIKRTAFDSILEQAVHSCYVPEIYGTPDQWKARVASSAVRLQWDPDHDPAGRPVARRAIQLGLRGHVLANYAREWIVSIEDISRFVLEQQRHLLTGGVNSLSTPREEPYPVSTEIVASRLGVETTSQISNQ